MAPLIESHPQRDKIHEAILAGQSPDSIAAWCTPKLHRTTIWRYQRNVVAPALRRQGEIANALRQNELLKAKIQELADSGDVSGATKLLESTDPLISRIAAKYQRYDRTIPQAEDSKDFRSVAALDRAETAALLLHAQLTGRLNQGNTTNILVQVAMEKPQAEIQTDTSEVIDITPVTE